MRQNVIRIVYQDCADRHTSLDVELASQEPLTAGQMTAFEIVAEAAEMFWQTMIEPGIEIREQVK